MVAEDGTVLGLKWHDFVKDSSREAPKKRAKDKGGVRSIAVNHGTFRTLWTPGPKTDVVKEGEQKRLENRHWWSEFTAGGSVLW